MANDKSTTFSQIVYKVLATCTGSSGYTQKYIAEYSAELKKIAEKNIIIKYCETDDYADFIKSANAGLLNVSPKNTSGLDNFYIFVTNAKLKPNITINPPEGISASVLTIENLLWLSNKFKPLQKELSNCLSPSANSLIPVEPPRNSNGKNCVVQLYTFLAEKGNAFAQCSLGIIYDYGYGVEQDYKKAVELFTLSAEQGYARAQNSLGYMYDIGRGVKQDYKKAVEYYTLSAKQGNAMAQNNLGYMYDMGYGVGQNYKKAVEYYTLSAEQGLARAQCNLGCMYDMGYGVEQDDKKAVEYYTLSAEQGFAGAQCNLGVMYKYGQGVKQDYKKAVEYYTLSAEQGNAVAQRNLGTMYKNGQGVEQDYKKAYTYYKLSAEQGNETAKDYLESLILKHPEVQETEAGQKKQDENKTNTQSKKTNNEPSTEQEKTTDTEPLNISFERLKNIPAGREDETTKNDEETPYKEYEKFCFGLIKTFFLNEGEGIKNNLKPLEKIESQKTNNDGLYKFDIVASLKDDQVLYQPKDKNAETKEYKRGSFWKFIYDKYNSDFIIFECKNYEKPIMQGQILTTARYLYDTALRNVAIILCRKGETENAKKTRCDILREQGKLILVLDDNDIKEMIDRYDANFDEDDHGAKFISKYLLDKAKDFLLNIDKHRAETPVKDNNEIIPTD